MHLEQFRTLQNGVLSVGKKWKTICVLSVCPKLCIYIFVCVRAHLTVHMLITGVHLPHYRVCSRYNQLLRIEQELGSLASFAGFSECACLSLTRMVVLLNSSAFDFDGRLIGSLTGLLSWAFSIQKRYSWNLSLQIFRPAQASGIQSELLIPFNLSIHLRRWFRTEKVR